VYFNKTIEFIHTEGR